MDLFSQTTTEKEKIFRGLILLAIFVLIAILGYFSLKSGAINLTNLFRLPASIRQPAEENLEEVAQETSNFTLFEAGKIQEIAETGEGTTNLARRAVKQYLQANPQSFNLTPEHKVYIEDYLVKKIGASWLNLGQTLEFSENLIKEAIDNSANLSQTQLNNLTQYSQLVLSLNY